MSIEKYAEIVLELITKRPLVDVIISTRDGKFLTSSMSKSEALDKQSCVSSLTEKTKVLLGKLLDEELCHIRIRGNNNEIMVTLDDYLEITTIQKFTNNF